MSIDIAMLAGLVCEAGQAEIVPRFRRLQAGDVGQKASDIDLVTEADVGAERHLTAALLQRFPDALIVGEETYATNPGVIARLADAELAFVIDPVDGTFNFAAGNPMFGTILAAVRNGETVGGILCDPLRRDMVVAEKGSGARLVLADGNTKPVAVAPPTSLDQMIAAMTWTYLQEPLRAQVGANIAKIRLQMAYGCSCYEYWMVASGRVHFTAHQYLNPWDHLAGVLIHQEAGGHSAKFDGSPYRPADTVGGILSAPDRDSWDLIRREIIGKL